MTFNSDLTLEFANLSVKALDLPPVTQEYLLRLGFSTALKNVHAGVRAGVMGNTKNPDDAWSDETIAAEAQAAGLTEWGRNDATVEGLISHYQREKLNDLLAGKLASRREGTPRLSPDDKLRRDIAIEFMVAAAKAKGKELPKRSKPEEREAFDALLSKAMAVPAFSQKVEKEFKARRKSASAEVEGLDELFV